MPPNYPKPLRPVKPLDNPPLPDLHPPPGSPGVPIPNNPLNPKDQPPQPPRKLWEVESGSVTVVEDTLEANVSDVSMANSVEDQSA